MAAISHVFTISHVAAILREDEDTLQALAESMEPEDGCLHIIGIGEGVTAFTKDGIENLRELLLDSKE
ncbi:MAG: hypothetical protein IT560_13895 [Alphaproteobacteria bacterium]|nr:hypothetical protein [Alphaproteobacteria bacterium]